MIYLKQNLAKKYSRNEINCGFFTIYFHMVCNYWHFNRLLFTYVLNYLSAATEKTMTSRNLE